MKNVRLNNVDILEKFLRNQALKKQNKTIADKDDFEIFRSPYVTFNDL